MTAFTPHVEDGAEDEFDRNAAIPPKRPPRWALTNWPVRWKVFAIVLVPLLLAGAFGGLRIYSGWSEAGDLRLAADRAEMVPAIDGYMAALEGALSANSTGGDAQASLTAFDSSKQDLERHLADTDVSSDVRAGVQTLLEGGQSLLDKVTSNSIGLRERITTYAPILLTAEDSVNASVRVGDEQIRATAAGLSRAMGARGQMVMQQSLVNLGGELPEPELRTSMITLAGTEPSTLFGMTQVLGVGSADAQTLQAEMVKRMAIMSDPAVPLANNPDLLQSIQATNQIAGQVIAKATPDLSTAVEAQASAKRKEAIRDAAIVGASLLVALLVVTLVARSLVKPLRRLRDGALRVAHEDLVRELELVRSGADPGPIQLVPVHTSEEVGQVAHAVDELHEQAVLLAGEQARLQLQVGDMFETLSRRSRSLVDQQLALIDRLERNEADPERLDSLFQLDHLAARMRRNGANLLVLSGTKVQREYTEPVTISSLVHAAASEVEDYARVITDSVPDDEVLGFVVGDLVHVLAELLDNALRYSPPTSHVRVSAVHTEHGGMVIEVADAGLGMAESDMRVANTRLRAGGEVDPFTARHMGLFVVGRLAAEHGLVVRLRSTIPGRPDSGTTAGIYVKPELLVRGAASHQPDVPSYVIPDDPYGETANALAFAEDPTYYHADDEPYQERHDAHFETPVSFMPQRNPAYSGISAVPFVDEDAEPYVGHDDEWADDPQPEKIAEVLRPAVWQPDDAGAQFGERPPLPVRSQGYAADHEPVQSAWDEHIEPPVEPPVEEPTAEEPTAESATEDDTSNSIFDTMLSEWLIDDPVQLAHSADLDWKTVWDHGWSAASAAADAPVAQHTASGLPMREPGARLIPGGADPVGDDHEETANGHHRNGGRSGVEDAEPRPGVPRDPDAVRSSLSNHFGGVKAGRARARDTEGTDEE